MPRRIPSPLAARLHELLGLSALSASSGIWTREKYLRLSHFSIRRTQGPSSRHPSQKILRTCRSNDSSECTREQTRSDRPTRIRLGKKIHRADFEAYTAGRITRIFHLHLEGSRL